MPTLTQFYKEMNKHSNADYRLVGGAVLEFERVKLSRELKGRISAWRRDEDGDWSLTGQLFTTYAVADGWWTGLTTTAAVENFEEAYPGGSHV